MWRTGVIVSIVVACGGPSTSNAPTVPVAEPVKPAPPAERSEHGFAILDRAPADALELKVRAIRWDCAVYHAHHVITPDLRVPAGRTIKLVVWTPEWPQVASGLEVSFVGTTLRKPIVKDAPVEIVFRVDAPGTFEWKCPTITPPWREPEPGVTVSDEARARQNPIKTVTVMPAAEYDAMLVASDPELPANKLALGRKLYEKKGCVACHTTDGSARVGPSWAGIWGTTVKLADGSTRVVDASYVKASILTPQAFARPGFPPSMPSFEGQLRDREIDALVAFIEQLKSP